jgi:hypothetical protein
MSATSLFLPVTRLLESVSGAADGRLIEVRAYEHQPDLHTDPNMPSIGRGAQAGKPPCFNGIERDRAYFLTPNF